MTFWTLKVSITYHSTLITDHLFNKLELILNKLDNSCLLNGQKIQIYKIGLKAFLSWHFMINDINKNFIKTKLNTFVEKFICKWADINYKNSTKCTIYLKPNHFGLGICNIWTFYKKCQLSKYMILRQSVDLVLTKNIFNIVLKDYLDRLSVNKTNNYKWYGIVVAVNL